jgi:hypothetical protein
VARIQAWSGARLRVGLQVAVLLVAAVTLFQSPRAMREFSMRTHSASHPEAQAAQWRVMQFVAERTRSGHTLLAMGFSEKGIGPYNLRQYLFDTATGAERNVVQLPYPGLPAEFGYSAEPSPLYAKLLQETLAAYPEADLVLFRHDSPHFRGPMFPWAFAWHLNYLAAAEQMTDWRAVAELDTGAGLVVKVYRRTGP